MRMKTRLLFIFLANIARAGTYHQAIDYVFPLPDSKLLPVKTTVILKLDETYNSRITNLSDLIVVKDDGVVRGGTTFFATDNRTIIFKPNNELQSGKTMTVSVQLGQFGFENFEYNFTTAKNSGNDLDWLNKTNARPGPSINGVKKYSPVRLINGVAVPSDFPEIRANIFGETAPGRIFIPANKWIIICENDGTPYFYRKYEDGHEKMRFEAHPTGVLSFHSYEVYDVILDRNFVEIDTVYPGHGYLPDDHELQILENGHMLLVAREFVRIDMNEIVSGGKSNARVEAHHIQELDRDHNVIFEWRNWDHLDIRETGVSLQGNHVDFVHTNSIAVDYDGHLIISPREYNMIMKIDRITSETIWILGGEQSDFDFINEDIQFSRIHDVRPVPGKPDHYTLFDNGRDRDSGKKFSRGVEYKLDPDAKTAEKVWEYRHNPDLYSSYCGGTQPFENGNRLISWANNDYYTEVNSSEERVYEMFVQGFSCSRGRRCDWEGKMLHPYLVLENLGDTIRLIFNKFGDNNVDHYRIYSGENENSLSYLDSTGRTYYDIHALSLGNEARYVFQVSAIDKNGQESGPSNRESTYVRIVAPGENAVKNGEFESTDHWRLVTSGGARAGVQIDDEGQMQISIERGGSRLESVQLLQENLLVMTGKDYVFEFDAYASRTKQINAKIESDDNNSINYGGISDIAITTRSKRYQFDFPMRYPTDANARVVFNCGMSTGDVFIDNVSLTYKNSDNDIQPLAAPWENSDIGHPQISGFAGTQDDKFIIRGSGNDIWGQSDAFHYVYREIEGDAEITARIYSLEETDPWSKAGVMMRNTLQASSSHAMMIMSASNGAAFQRRAQTGGPSTHSPGETSGTPNWVRLIREGNVFTGYESSDGQTWQRVDSQKIDMDQKIYIGLPVTSHNDGVICEAKLDNVQLVSASDTAVNQNKIPESFGLLPAFPNPFNTSATIQFNVPQNSHIKLNIFDVRGNKVKTLLDKNVRQGSHRMTWEGQDDSGKVVATGLYFIHMSAGGIKITRKLTLLR